MVKMNSEIKLKWRTDHEILESLITKIALLEVRLNKLEGRYERL